MGTKIAFLVGQDYCGSLHNLYNAMKKYTNCEVIYTFKRGNILHYPYEEEEYCWNYLDKREEIRKLIHNSDVIFIKKDYACIDMWKLDRAILSKKIIIFWFSGGEFIKTKTRQKIIHYMKRFSDVRWAVTTPNFLESSKELKSTWIPLVQPIDSYRKKYDYSKSNPPLIAKVCGERDTKRSRPAFRWCIRQLKKNNIKFKSDLIGDGKYVVNDECLKRKARASIFFDRFEIPSYANNCIEAAGFESVVLTNDSPFVIREATKHARMKFPFINVRTRGELYVQILRLLKQPNERKRIGKKSYSFVKRLHDGHHSARVVMELINR